MPVISGILLFTFGSIIGSFLNVLTLRYDPEGKLFDVKKLSGRSHCVQCGKILSWAELVPVLSFLFLRGKCSACGGKISWQYVFVEIASGLIFLFVPFFLSHFYEIKSSLFFSGDGPWWIYTLALLWVGVFLIWLVMTVIDIRHYLIPDELNLLLGIFGIAVALLSILVVDEWPILHESFLTRFILLFSPTQNIILTHLLGMAVGAGLFGALSIFSKGRAMGFGDVKLALSTGILFGWPDIGLILILSFISGGLVGVFTIARKKKTMKDRLPFAPFFILGCILTFFLGTSIIQGYFDLFSLY